MSAEHSYRRWITLGALTLTSFIGTWDVAAPVVALPAITRQFNVGIDSAVWVITIESLLFAIPMAIFGKLGDMLGHKRTFLVASGSFMLFAMLAATARSFGWLILFRGLQGLASSPGFTATMAMIATTFPAEERGRAMGLQGTAAALGWAIGPALGGFLMLKFNWQAILFLEVPLAGIAFGLAWWLMPNDVRTPKPTFDLVGALSLAMAALTLMLIMMTGGQRGWISLPTLMMGTLFVVSAGVFLIAEKKTKAPFVPLSLFSNRGYATATAFSVTQLIMMLAMITLVPVYMQEVTAVDAATAGLFVTVLSIARVIFAPLAGRVAELRGSRLPSLAAVGLLFAIILGFALWLSPDTPGWVIFAGMFAFGAGVSFGRVPVNAAVTHLIDPQNIGLAMGVFSMLTFIGGSLGQTFFGVVLRVLSGAGNAPLATAPLPALSRAFSVCFGVTVAVAVLSWVLGLRLPGRDAPISVVTARG